MKRVLVLTVLASLMLVGALAIAGEGKKAMPGKAMKPMAMQYMISVPHTPEECLKALDEFDVSKALTKFEFGCESGDHTGYAIVTASSPEAALAMVPEDQRANAKVVAVHKFTPAELKAAHEKMK